MNGFGRLTRGELLRARSGSSFPLLLSYAVIVPLMALMMSGTIDGLDALADAAATRSVFAFVASVAIGACFYGAYAYTRETYYHSLDRTLLLGTRAAVFAAKAAAGAYSGAIFGVVGLACWAVVTPIVLAASGRAIALHPVLVATALGALLASVLCGMIGVALGYALRNYYLGIPVILVLPAVLAGPMLTNARPVERYLPIGAVAGATAAPLDGLLPAPLALLVLLGWTAAAVGAARWIDGRRSA
ncbi:hypothetical protein HQQ81_07120 [Microbacteriaceae bacterium VKM Ac-2854]|nr:hypothetical protein [Microbacteriaceae bacterium VKM Ac-2854]